MDIKSIIKSYDLKNLTIGVIGSHSALDVCRGAKDLGFKTLVISQKGREKTYDTYFKTNGSVGIVDECLVLEKFSDILNDDVQRKLLDKNTIFIPNRSFEVYLNSDYDSIENEFMVPMFGNRFLLKSEERSVHPNQYDLLKEGRIRIPQQFKDPKDIDRLCIVKVLEQERGFERAFFLVSSYEDFLKEVEKRIEQKIFSEEQLKSCVIEEFVVGVQVNFNFFYSPICKRLELVGTDTRRQTNIEGLNKLPSLQQNAILDKINVKYEEAGHIAVTVLESMLEDAFALGESFVQATQKLFHPGVIGPFALQSVITAGPPKKEIVVFDISPRMPGSPGTFSTPYSGYLFGQSMSVGKRVAMEISEAIYEDHLEDILS